MKVEGEMNTLGTDHEFPWVEFHDYELKCTRCGKSGEINGWLEFLGVHQHCREIEGRVDHQ